MTTKKCTKCGEKKELEAFGIDKAGKFGRQYYCKSCKKIANAEYRKNHKVEAKKYRKANAELLKDISKIWRATNHNQILARNAARRAYKKNACPSYANKEKILEFYKEAKRRTKETGVKHVVDHYYPLQGKASCGLHVENNLQIITADENLRKGNKLPEEFYNQNK